MHITSHTIQFSNAYLSFFFLNVILSAKPFYRLKNIAKIADAEKAQWIKFSE